MSTPKRHHYLPRFLIDGFSEGGRIWVFDRMRREFRRQTPNGTAVIGQYYTMEMDGGQRDYTMEKLLAGIEGQAKPVIEKLAASAEVTALDRVQLARFLSFLFVRNPKARREREEIVDMAAKHLMKAKMPSLEAVKHFLDQENSTLDPQGMYDFIHNEEYRLKVHQNEQLVTMIDHAHKIGFGILAMDWAFVHAPLGAEFVLSDCSVGYMFREKPTADNVPGLGVLSDDVTKVVTLTKGLALLMLNRSSKLVHAVVNSEVVDQINESVALEADGLVIGSAEALVRGVVERTRIDHHQTQTKMKLEEVPHPTDPLRSYLVTRRIDPNLPDLPIQIETQGDLGPRRIEEKKGAYRVIQATPTEASILHFELDEDHTGVIIRAIESRNALTVADAKIWKRENRGYVLDLYVRCHCEEVEPWWGFVAKRTGLWKPLARDWRRCGVGGRLIDLSLTWLREHGATHVYGQVMKSAVTEQPWLLAWYQRKGFEIRQPPPIEGSAVHSLIWKEY